MTDTTHTIRPDISDEQAQLEAQQYLTGEGETVQAMGAVTRSVDDWGHEQITVVCDLLGGGTYGQGAVTLPAEFFGADFDAKLRIANSLRVD
jgi:hypothetical protein